MAESKAEEETSLLSKEERATTMAATKKATSRSTN
jgi:hypothetical protein